MRLTFKKGPNGTSTKTEKLKGEPDESGYVPDNWAVGEFSPRNVLAKWGDGRYRVEWYGEDGEHMKGQGQTFDVAKPRVGRPPGSRKLSPSKNASADDDDREPIDRATEKIASGGSLNFVELMAMMRAEREDQERRAQAQAERDRQFWMQMQSQQTQLLTTILGSGGGRSTGAAETDLLKREMQLDLDRKLFDLRRELEPGPEPEPEDPDDDVGEPPKDINEAVERIGMSFLGELEGAAPSLVQKMIPKFLEMLRAQGVTPSPEMQERIAAAQNGHAVRG